MENILEMNNVCKETLIILSFFDEELLDKIPTKIFKKLNEFAADSKCEFYIDKNKDLLEQNISEKSKDLISLLYYSYIANEEEKKELSNIWNENEIKFQKVLKEKYDSYNIFKKVDKNENIKKSNITNHALIEHKESFLEKFKNFILKIFHINNK